MERTDEGGLGLEVALQVGEVVLHLKPSGRLQLASDWVFPREV